MKLVDVVGHFSSEIGEQRLRKGDEVFAFDLKNPSEWMMSSMSEGGCAGHGLGRSVFLEQEGRDFVHGGVGALRGEHDGYAQLKRRQVIEEQAPSPYCSNMIFSMLWARCRLVVRFLLAYALSLADGDVSRPSFFARFNSTTDARLTYGRARILDHLRRLRGFRLLDEDAMRPASLNERIDRRGRGAVGTCGHRRWQGGGWKGAVDGNR